MSECMKNVFLHNVNKLRTLYAARMPSPCLLPRFGLCETSHSDDKKNG